MSRRGSWYLLPLFHLEFIQTEQQCRDFIKDLCLFDLHQRPSLGLLLHCISWQWPCHQILMHYYIKNPLFYLFTFPHFCYKHTISPSPRKMFEQANSHSSTIAPRNLLKFAQL